MIPAEIGELTQLKELNISWNEFTGECWSPGSYKVRGTTLDNDVTLYLFSDAQVLEVWYC